ncbi:MAG: ABC transporter permease [Comamonadaceae bacterium]|nr:ABC transporter permease [Comamonadaceae bacterium]
MPFLLELAWRDLRAGGRQLWVLAACLVLGVSLVAAGGGLYRQVADGLRDDARLLFGGDVEVAATAPLPTAALDWMAARGTVSRVLELRTMLRTADGRAQLVELMSTDAAYPLYGAVELAPAMPLTDALALRDGLHGVALDAALALRLGLQPGDRVAVGDAELRVGAVVQRQPDRSLRADWGAAPVLLSDAALQATGLVQPLSRVDHLHRVRMAPGSAPSAAAWRDAFIAAHPGIDAEVRSFDERSDRMTEVLGQIGSGLLLIGFAALFIGGLGVFNSVQTWLQGRLVSLATLRAVGLRNGRLAAFVLLQIGLLALLASLVGVLLGIGVAAGVAQLAAERAPVRLLVQGLWQPALLALLFGVLTALTFSLPALGRALSVSPAVLFRGADAAALMTPARARWLTAGAGLLLLVLLVLSLPDPRFGLAFVLTMGLLLLLLDGLTRLLRRAAARWQHHGPLPLQLALAGLQHPQSPLRTALLSMGSALTLMVACTLVVFTLLRTLQDTVPEQAPALVMYDVQTGQIDLLRQTLQTEPDTTVRTAPLVLGRLVAVNGQALREGGDADRARESLDEHKLSDRSGNFDDVLIDRGAWWPDDHRGEALVAMEDREADGLGLQVGDRLRFEIMGSPVDVTLSAIYSQRRLQSRLWLEAIFSDGVLDPFITRHVGAAWMPPGQALQAQDRLAAVAPNIATARTEALLQESRRLLERAGSGLAVVAGVCLAASLLVLASVVAASRSRQVFEATVMHALGARHSLLRQVLWWEYLVLAAITAGLAWLAGSLWATVLLKWQLDMTPAGLYWTGAATVVGVCAFSLLLGGRYLTAQWRLSPALLLRSGG